MSYEMDYLFHERNNDKDFEMKKKGFKFITNFTLEREEPYQRAAEIHNIRYSFENEVYGQSRKLGDDGSWMKAFYVDSEINDLSEFWRTVDELKVATK